MESQAVDRGIDDAGDPDPRTIQDVGTDPIEAPLSPAGAELPEGGVSQRDAADEEVTYRTIGGVLSEVNGQAIYTDEVIDARRNQLRAMALRMDPIRFQREAINILQRELSDRLRDKVLLSVFERNISSFERQQAQILTTLWRKNFITNHGGSEATARRAAREQFGLTLEELGEDEYRRRLSQTFVQKHVAPRIRPGVEQLREEYERRAAAGEMDVPGEIVFSLIEIRPESQDEIAVKVAEERAKLIHQKALAGEDFAELARLHSDNDGYAERGGRPPEWLLPLAPDSFAIKPVDEAAWATEEGQVGPIVTVDAETSPVFYIVRVDEKSVPRTLPFSEVQRRLANEMANAEQARLMEEYFAVELARIDGPTPEEQNLMLQTALEVMMQSYDDWRSGGATSRR
jgi:hypothetical protein